MGNHLHLMVGGQAVMEGIMMRNGSEYSVAVRKENGEIEVIEARVIIKTIHIQIALMVKELKKI